MIPTALSIAGSDSSGCAGIQADLKTMAALGVHGTSVITAITAQSSVRVSGVHPLPPAFVRLQLDAVASDLNVRATKTGMLANVGIVRAVAEALESADFGPLVVDPVMLATSGGALLQGDAIEALRELLLPLATLVTPNSDEAARLAGRPVETLGHAEEAAQTIAALGCGAVLVKGGHLRDPNADPSCVVDVLWDGATLTRFERRRLPTPHTRGTGCTFASAITARIAHGDGLLAAISAARDYLQGAIARGYSIGAGAGPLGH